MFFISIVKGLEVIPLSVASVITPRVKPLIFFCNLNFTIRFLPSLEIYFTFGVMFKLLGNIVIDAGFIKPLPFKFNVIVLPSLFTKTFLITGSRRLFPLPTLVLIDFGELIISMVPISKLPSDKFNLSFIVPVDTSAGSFKFRINLFKFSRISVKEKGTSV